MTTSKITIEDRAQAIVDLHKNDPTQQIITTLPTMESTRYWRVQSFDNRDSYIVSYNMSQAIWECTCRYYLYKGPCKHIGACKIIEEKEIYVMAYTVPYTPKENDNHI